MGMVNVKIKQSHHRLGQAPQVSRRLSLLDLKTPGTWRWQGYQPCAPAVFITHEIFLVQISVRDWVSLRAIVRSEGLFQLKNSNDTIGNRTRDPPACSAVPQLRHRVPPDWDSYKQTTIQYNYIKSTRMCFILMAWRWPSYAETCCHNTVYNIR